MVKAHLCGYCIRSPEAYSPDIIRQLIRIFLYHLNTVIPIGLIYLCGMASADIVSLQEEHDILDLLLLCPAFLYSLYPNFTYALHIDQEIRLMFDDLQGLLLKFIYDLFCEFRTDTLYKSAPEIFFYPVNRRGKSLFKGFHRKLPSVFLIDLPASSQRQNTSHMDIRHTSYHRHKV